MSVFIDDALERLGIDNASQLPSLQKPYDTSTLVEKVQEVLQ